MFTIQYPFHETWWEWACCQWLFREASESQSQIQFCLGKETNGMAHVPRFSFLGGPPGFSLVHHISASHHLALGCPPRQRERALEMSSKSKQEIDWSGMKSAFAAPMVKKRPSSNMENLPAAKKPAARKQTSDDDDDDEDEEHRSKTKSMRFSKNTHTPRILQHHLLNIPQSFAVPPNILPTFHKTWAYKSPPEPKVSWAPESKPPLSGSPKHCSAKNYLKMWWTLGIPSLLALTRLPSSIRSCRRSVQSMERRRVALKGEKKSSPKMHSSLFFLLQCTWTFSFGWRCMSVCVLPLQRMQRADVGPLTSPTQPLLRKWSATVMKVPEPESRLLADCICRINMAVLRSWMRQWHLERWLWCKARTAWSCTKWLAMRSRPKLERGPSSCIWVCVCACTHVLGFSMVSFH